MPRRPSYAMHRLDKHFCTVPAGSSSDLHPNHGQGVRALGTVCAFYVSQHIFCSSIILVFEACKVRNGWRAYGLAFVRELPAQAKF